MIEHACCSAAEAEDATHELHSMTHKIIEQVSSREELNPTMVAQLLSGMSPSSEADTDRVLSVIGVYLGNMTVNKSVPMKKMFVDSHLLRKTMDLAPLFLHSQDGARWFAPGRTSLTYA